MKHTACILFCGWVYACNSPALPYREAPTQSFQVHFYVENGSETQPATDLRIQWDTTIVAQDTFRYTGIADNQDVYSLLTKSGLHRIKVTNSKNKLVRDTTIMVDSLTHVFVDFRYTKLDSTELIRIRNLHPPEGEQAVINALSEPKSLIIYVMKGPISR